MTEAELQEGTRQVPAGSLQGTWEEHLRTGKSLFPGTAGNQCFILRKSQCRLCAQSSNVIKNRHLDFLL